jgi:hypothetical protein
MTWQMVPAEMTDAMLAEAWRAAHRVMTDDRCNHAMLRAAWSAALAAAPKPAAKEG